MGAIIGKASDLVDHSAAINLFFFIAPAPIDIYTLSLHDALPIFTRISRRRPEGRRGGHPRDAAAARSPRRDDLNRRDRKSTRLNSSHVSISYAVFCLKKKKVSAPASAPRRLFSTLIPRSTSIRIF